MDTALRPDGRNGPLVRSLGGHVSYYERWAKTWEFQALLKARPVAGDLALGREFVSLVEPMVWQVAERDGFVMGEGAALLVLEAADVAERRGATPYAELRGFAATSDAYHMVQPRPDGLQAARAARLALADGRMRATDIDYVNAHASSTPLGDAAEALALARALGRRAREIPIAGTKAYYGHPLGASGGRILGTLAHRLRESGDRWGVAAICIGVGQGLAVVLENAQ